MRADGTFTTAPLDQPGDTFIGFATGNADPAGYVEVRTRFDPAPATPPTPLPGWTTGYGTST